MQDIARGAYAVSHAIAIAAFLWPGWWRRLPIFFACLCASSVIAFTYAPESRAWIAGTYGTWEPLAVALRFCAAIEIIWILSAALPDRWRLILILSHSLAGVAVAATIWQIEPGYPIYAFVQVRRYVQIGTAVSLMAGLLGVWGLSLLNKDRYLAHALILLLLLCKQAAYSLISIRWPWTTMRQWQAADWPGLIVTSLCLTLWIGLATRRETPAQ